MVFTPINLFVTPASFSPRLISLFCCKLRIIPEKISSTSLTYLNQEGKAPTLASSIDSTLTPPWFAPYFYAGTVMSTEAANPAESKRRSITMVLWERFAPRLQPHSTIMPHIMFLSSSENEEWIAKSFMLSSASCLPTLSSPLQITHSVAPFDIKAQWKK